MRHLNIDHFVLQPFPQSGHGLAEVASGLETRVRHRFNVDLGQCMGEQSLEVSRE
jgi:hypothetical protein